MSCMALGPDVVRPQGNWRQGSCNALRPGLLTWGVGLLLPMCWGRGSRLAVHHVCQQFW